VKGYEKGGGYGESVWEDDRVWIATGIKGERKPYRFIFPTTNFWMLSSGYICHRGLSIVVHLPVYTMFSKL